MSESEAAAVDGEAGAVSSGRLSLVQVAGLALSGLACGVAGTSAAVMLVALQEWVEVLARRVGAVVMFVMGLEFDAAVDGDIAPSSLGIVLWMVLAVAAISFAGTFAILAAARGLIGSRFGASGAARRRVHRNGIAVTIGSVVLGAAGSFLWWWPATATTGLAAQIVFLGALVMGGCAALAWAVTRDLYRPVRLAREEAARIEAEAAMSVWEAERAARKRAERERKARRFQRLVSAVADEIERRQSEGKGDV